MSHENHILPRFLALVPDDDGAILAALTSLSVAHGQPARLVSTSRLDAAFVTSWAPATDPEFTLGCLLRGTLGACPISDPTHVPMFLPLVDVAESSIAPIRGDDVPVRLGELGDARLELVVRQLGWSPRICDQGAVSLHAALTWARHEIRVLQATAHEGIVPSKVAWPLVLVRPSRGGVA